MARDDAERWDSRYDGQQPPTPAPPSAIVRFGCESVIPSSGRALDIACGTGAQSTWLAQRGLSVTSIDVSPLAIRIATAGAAAAGCAARVDPRVVDLDNGLPPDTAPVDVIVCQRFRDPDLYDPIVQHLAVGGIAVVTVLSAVGAASPGPFHAPPGELARAFDQADVEILAADEGNGESSVVFRRVADAG